MSKPLTVARAKTLARALSGRDSGWLSTHGCVRVRVDEDADRVVFEHVELVRRDGYGWDFGKVLSAHSLCLSVSTEARVVAHYEGFCENHGFGIAVGDTVSHPSASATSGWRRAKIVAITGRRVRVAGRFNYGGPYEVSVMKGDLRIDGRKVERRRSA